MLETTPFPMTVESNTLAEGVFVEAQLELAVRKTRLRLTGQREMTRSSMIY